MSFKLLGFDMNVLLLSTQIAVAVWIVLYMYIYNCPVTCICNVHVHECFEVHVYCNSCPLMCD